jgi:hypothetical protein
MLMLILRLKRTGARAGQAEERERREATYAETEAGRAPSKEDDVCLGSTELFREETSS